MRLMTSKADYAAPILPMKALLLPVLLLTFGLFPSEGSRAGEFLFFCAANSGPLQSRRESESGRDSWTRPVHRSDAGNDSHGMVRGWKV